MSMPADTRRFSLSLSTVSRVGRKYQKMGRYTQRGGQGHRKASTRQQDALLSEKEEEHCQWPTKCSPKLLMCMFLTKQLQTSANITYNNLFTFIIWCPTTSQWCHSISHNHTAWIYVNNCINKIEKLNKLIKFFCCNHIDKDNKIQDFSM